MESGDRVRRRGRGREETVRLGGGGGERGREVTVEEGLAVALIGKFVRSSVGRGGGSGHGRRFSTCFGSCDKTLANSCEVHA